MPVTRAQRQHTICPVLYYILVVHTLLTWKSITGHNKLIYYEHLLNFTVFTLFAVTQRLVAMTCNFSCWSLTWIVIDIVLLLASASEVNGTVNWSSIFFTWQNQPLTTVSWHLTLTQLNHWISRCIRKPRDDLEWMLLKTPPALLLQA
jgi:hypothetical protein